MTGENSKNIAEINAVGTNGKPGDATFKPTWNTGWTFYANTDNATGPTIFFPAPGWRNVFLSSSGTGELRGVGADGNNWVVIANSDKIVCYFNFSKNHVITTFYGSRAFGLPIRPVREQ